MFKKTLSFVLALLVVASMIVLPVSAGVGDYKFYEREPNNSTSTADRVYSGYTIFGSAGKYDLDYYKFTLSSRTTVTLVGACSYSTLFVGIENSAGRTLYTYQPTYSGSGYSFGKNVTLAAGTYYLCVLSSNVVSYSKTYTLYLEYASSPSTHIHSYSNSCDSTCNTCGATRSVSHSYRAATCTQARTCVICGITSGSALGHSYREATCIEPATCTVCGMTTGSAADHSYRDATCTEPATCTVCGMTTGSTLDHNYQEATCTEPSTCSVCGITAEPALGHIYSGDCDAACNRCDEEREAAEHVYAGECDTTCEICQAERTISHSYLNDCDETCELCQEVRVAPHAYDNSCDSTCNGCEATREPGAHEYDNSCDDSCNICDAIRTVEGHKYTNACDTTCNKCKQTRKITHKYKTTTVKATLSKNGSVTKKCTVCEKVSSKTTIKAVKSIKLSSTSFAYNNKAKKPSVTVKDAAGNTLKKDTDYTVSYASGRKNVGTYKVTVKLMGKYSGSKTLTFTVRPTTKTDVSMLVGDTTNIGAKSNTSIKYSTSDKNIATVSSKGVITAKKTGTVTISVKSGKITQKIKVTVKKPTVKITGSESVLLKKSVTLKAVTNCDSKVTWSSSDKKIATVSSSGKVTGQKAGTAIISAKISYNGKTYTAKFEITVKKPYLSKTSASIDKGKTARITVKGGSGTISYKTSDSSVATVSSEGVVKGLKKGTCTITVKRNGYSMSFKVTVREKDYSKITLYEDSTVRISFKSAEKYKYSDDRLELYFFVENKTGRTRLIQADAVSLNGYSFCELTMSDPVTPYSTGIVNVSVDNFDFDLVNINSISSIGGQFRIIDDATWKGYDALFAPTRLDGKGRASRPSVPNNKLLYSDSNCAIYYRNIAEDKYNDDEAELYLYVENKTNKTLLIQADAISVNGYSHSDLTMSDPVLPQTVGIVNVSIDDFYYSGISLNNIKTIGGQLRIIDDATRKSYDAVFTNTPVK